MGARKGGALILPKAYEEGLRRLRDRGRRPGTPGSGPWGACCGSWSPLRLGGTGGRRAGSPRRGRLLGREGGSGVAVRPARVGIGDGGATWGGPEGSVEGPGGGGPPRRGAREGAEICGSKMEVGHRACRGRVAKVNTGEEGSYVEGTQMETVPGRGMSGMSGSEYGAMAERLCHRPHWAIAGRGAPRSRRVRAPPRRRQCQVGGGSSTDARERRNRATALGLKSGRA